ncbi:MAG TPA: hypothetical protein VHF91_03170 [Acidimicrobiales bacterium]|nr:hypothetical protein [Acidimicrobiales bacterium]
MTYYRHEWAKLLVASVGLVRVGFRMRWDRTLRGAWLVLRANQLWAPVDNDPDRARRCMERFYRLVATDSGESIDTAEAARPEIEWWRVHRAVQRGPEADRERNRAGLVEALTDLYSYVYGDWRDDVRPAGRGHGRVGPVGRRRMPPRQPAGRPGAGAAGPLLRRPAGRGPPPVVLAWAPP